MPDREYEISTRAYCKMIMHSAKYPNSSLNGLLLARREDMTRSKTVRFCDSIPLFHIAVGLTPMLEMALAQVSCPARKGHYRNGFNWGNEEITRGIIT